MHAKALRDARKGQESLRVGAGDQGLRGQFYQGGEQGSAAVGIEVNRWFIQ
jgi:hypothetical protein